MRNVVEFEARTSIERQAREWLVLMDADEPLTRTQIEALREWMRGSMLRREELDRICKFWRQANVLTELAVCLDSAAVKRSARSGHWAAAIALAASALLASVIPAWWYLQRLDEKANGSYLTLIGQQKSVALPDGSSVQINTDSQVQVAYSGSLRKIVLLKGEALFSVTPDPKRPFEVYAAENVVRAVGTAFDVHLDGARLDVTVTKGIVDVAQLSEPPVAQQPNSHKGTPATASLGRLKAGQMTRVSTGSEHLDVEQLAQPELQRKMAWQEGYLAFSGEPLSQVIEQVNRYSPVTLELGDPKLASIAIGGRFRIGDLDAVLEALQTNFGIQAHRVDGTGIRLD